MFTTFEKIRFGFHSLLFVFLLAFALTAEAKDNKVFYTGHFACSFNDESAKRYVMATIIKARKKKFRIEKVNHVFCPDGSYQYVVTYQCTEE